MNCAQNRIDSMFQKKISAGQKALITFITAGDPDLATTRRLVLAMEKAGSDLVELGVPFSDPIAEGPVIQAANVRALQHDVRLDKLFELAADLRNNPYPGKTEIPLVFLLYANSIHQYGKRNFFENCRRNGIDGVIIPDLPLEESSEVEEEVRQSGVRLIRLVSPTSENRIEVIARRAQGFLYCVSSLGVTGMRASFHTDFDTFFQKINQYKNAPTALGFGISSPEQVGQLKKYADGIIVGSAIVQKIARAGSPDEAVSAVEKFVGCLRQALDDK